MNTIDIFDFHCGIGPWGHRDRLLPYKPEDVLLLMDHFGIGRALAHANFVGDSGSIHRGNEHVAAACAATDRFVPAMSVAPTVNHDVPQQHDYLAQLREAGAKAVWFAPRSAGSPARIYTGLFDLCTAHRLPLLIPRDGVVPEDLYQVMEQHPDLRVVLVGAHYTEDYLLYRLLERFPGFHVCLGHTYIPPGNPDRFLARFPADRLLFGSGLPFFSPGGMIGHVMYADIDRGAKEQILAGNAERLLSEVTR